MIQLPEGFVQPLLAWYSLNARPLPWRDEPTPYRVWVSEIMLQQTRIEAARDYFLRFMTEFPDVFALAEASEERVLKMWEGLGYYSRARNLHRSAQIIAADYGGMLPDSYAMLRKLPGVGDYTAGAIASIAYGLAEPAVDGNVLRVLSRLCSYDECVGSTKVRNEFRDALRAVYPASRAAVFTQALMEVGEVICTPGTPDCSVCPVVSFCRAKAEGRESELPVMPVRKPRRAEDRTVFLLVSNGYAAVRKRPERGLLAGLWEFPSVEGHLKPSEVLRKAEEMGCKPFSAKASINCVHIFTHVEWHMTGYFVKCAERSPGFTWITSKDLELYALPAAFRPFLHELREFWKES